MTDSQKRHEEFHGEESEDYQRFLDSMVQYCHCSTVFGRPCDGVLAGGLCDNLGNGPDAAEDLFDDDDENADTYT